MRMGAFFAANSGGAGASAGLAAAILVATPVSGDTIPIPFSLLPWMRVAASVQTPLGGLRPWRAGEPFCRPLGPECLNIRHRGFTPTANSCWPFGPRRLTKT